MSAYELLIILRPDLDDADLEKSLQNVRDLVVQRSGEIRKEDLWGRRKLAYQIKHYGEGYYALLALEMPGSVVSDLKRLLTIEADVLRFLLTEI